MPTVCSRPVGAGAAGGSRPADPLPHPRCERSAGGDPDQGRRGRDRCDRRGRGGGVGLDQPAEPQHDRWFSQRHGARHRARLGRLGRLFALLGDGPHLLQAVRQLAQVRERPAIRPRDPGRPVHQPPAAGRGPGSRSTLAGGRGDVCGCQPDAGRHRQGDSVQQGGGRSGPVPACQGHDLRRGTEATGGAQCRVPRVGGRHDAGVPR